MISSFLEQENEEIQKQEKGSGCEYELQRKYWFGFHLFKPFLEWQAVAANVLWCLKKEVSISLEKESQLKKR